MINPDVVDLNQFPDIPKVEWRYSTLEPGDCIYIPSGTFQCTHLLITKSDGVLRIGQVSRYFHISDNH